MEEKINIAEILKDKPEGTKLWTDMFGSVTLYVVTNTCDAFQVKHHNKEPWFDKDGKLYNEGVLCIYPSKSMRNWDKFAWKKGDVLANSRGLKILFDRWTNDNYTSFYAKTINLVEDAFLDTNLYTLASEKDAKSFIKCIEERLGGKLNIETLEIEKKSEFKDGDIIKMTWDKYSAIVIFWEYSNFGKGFDSHVFFNIEKKFIEYNIHGHILKDTILRLATEEEKKKLFDALAKEGKVWNSKKKQIVDLKPKWTPKTFDKVITRVHDKSIWTANIFSHIDQHEKYVTIGCISGYTYCLPYNDETAHLIGTTDEWKGCEG